MDSGQVIFILCRLFLGALASFLAIMLWSKTRDTAWIFVIIGIITAYTETIFSILNLFGIGGGNIIPESLQLFVQILLVCMPTIFFIAALAIMVIRKYHH